MNEVSYIYGLFDPADQVIRYVGQSTRPVARLGGHQSLRSSTNGVAAKIWIGEIIRQDRRPHMIILEVADFSAAHEVEAKWYQRIKGAGVKLVNEPTAIRRTKVHEDSKPYKHRLDPQQFCIIEPEYFYICHEPQHADTAQRFGTVLEFVSAWQEETKKVAVTLLASQVEAMEKLGDGNLSSGIRKAIEMNAAQARKLAVEAINSISQPGEHEPVADTTIVGMDSNGYWVTDNGEEVDGLTRDRAINIIIENLTTE